jgi:3-hydroxyacyl-[acyl-carrier-protein] dehydratase
MPPQLLFDISGTDWKQVAYDQQAIRDANPQRGEMEHLNAIVWVDQSQGQIIGYKDVHADEFWVEGHIPGRPLLPGVIMIEAAAQVASFYARVFEKWTGFIGFGGLEDCKFRQSVEPGSKLYFALKRTWLRHSRIACAAQGIVNGNIVFEATVIGVRM